MRICFIGKYPPIVGGVSAQTYWAARGLAERGHEIYVVTNADEVEEAYRVRLDADDAPHREPTFPATGGLVRIFAPEAPGPRMFHIPEANPFVSKLAGLATQVVREFGCQVIVAYYFEPYAVAGHLAASWTGVPLLVQHAGSDLDRLMRIPELGTTYKQVLRAADGVVTTPHLVRRFAGMGVPEADIHLAPPYPNPPSFNPDAEPLSPDDIDRLALQRPPHEFDPRLPTIGMYGKPGVVKGTYDLIGALGQLHREGSRFHLLLMIGRLAAEVQHALADAGLSGSAWLLPFLPHWTVPRFIRACTAVCFLERDFPVTIHGPVVPREVLACGTCLVLSGEIFGKQFYRDRLLDGVNVVVAANPKDQLALADQLSPLIERPELAKGIGALGHLVADDFAPHDKTGQAWEELLAPFDGRRPDTRAEPSRRSPSAPDSPDALLTQFLEERPGLIDLDLPDDCLPDIVRYQQARLWASQDDGLTHPPAPNALGGRSPSPANLHGLAPIVGVPLRIESFEYDVTPLLCSVGHSQVPARTATRVCFARLPNLAPSEHRINAATERLLTLCDGRRTTEEIVAQLGGEARKVHAALRGLYAHGLVAFQRPAATTRSVGPTEARKEVTKR